MDLFNQKNMPFISSLLMATGFANASPPLPPLTAKPDPPYLDDPCEKLVNNEDAHLKCLWDTFYSEKEELKNEYQFHLDEMEESGQFDPRIYRNQLVKSESAWEIFNKETCDYIGGRLGAQRAIVDWGSMLCQLNGIKARIQFFEDLPELN